MNAGYEGVLVLVRRAAAVLRKGKSGMNPECSLAYSSCTAERRPAGDGVQRPLR
jgi:hypothetical protein